MVYYERLLEAQGLQQKTQEALYLTLSLENREQYDASYTQALRYEEACEKQALQARLLPAYTGHPRAKEMVEDVMEKAIPVDIGFTKENWFAMRITALLPKKERGGPEFIRGFLRPAVRRFIQDRPPFHFENSVIVFHHTYDRDRPERLFRDHDNIEINAVVDILALHMLSDDSPMQCAHFYYSTVGDADSTEVYIVPMEDYLQFSVALIEGKLTGPEPEQNRP